MTDAQFISFVNAMDACWMERRFEDLRSFLAEDSVLVAPGGQVRIEGVDAAIESYRELMSHSHVRRYATADHAITLRGNAAVVEYRWEMVWSGDGPEHNEAGREVLVLAHRDSKWRVVWRTQIPLQD